MSAGILTNAGRDLFAAKQGAGLPLVIDRFLLANIAGLDPNLPADPNEPTPAPGDQVATLAVTQSGYVNADKVVYSLYMGTQVGDFTFNWVGLLADDDTLVAVRYIDPITKTATVGQVLGNAITRNFLITYTDAQAITNITVDAATWQVLFDAATTDGPGLVELATQAEMNAETDPARTPAVDVVAGYVNSKIAAAATPDATTAVKGKVELATQAEMNTETDPARTPAVDVVAGYVNSKITAAATPDATTAVKGKVELATQAEVDAETDTLRVITPSRVGNVFDSRLAGFLKDGTHVVFAGNLNTVLHNSTYLIWTGSGATNYPAGMGYLGFLTTDVNNAGNFATQTMTGINAPGNYRIWMRHYESSAWGAWIKVVDGASVKAPTLTTGANGYWLDNETGFMIQRGTVSVPPAGVTVTFPTTFPNAVWSVVGTQVTQVEKNANFVAASQNQSNFFADLRSGTHQVDWIAVGN